jgi:hypothetical protein
MTGTLVLTTRPQPHTVFAVSDDVKKYLTHTKRHEIMELKNTEGCNSDFLTHLLACLYDVSFSKKYGELF